MKNKAREYRKRKAQEISIVEQQEERRARKREYQREYRKRKTQKIIEENAEQRGNGQDNPKEITLEKHEEQRKRKSEQKRSYRQRKQYLNNSYMVQDEEENSMKETCIKHIDSKHQHESFVDMNI